MPDREGMGEDEEEIPGVGVPGQSYSDGPGPLNTLRSGSFWGPCSVL